MEKLLCPSMMCADFGNLEGEVRELDEAGADIFHLDVMDGVFVPNFALGLGDVEYVVSHTSKPCDVHLMIENPGAYVDLFTKLGARIVYVHPEADAHVTRTLARVRDAGAHPGIAVNPGTSFETVHELLPLVDYVLVMTVNPGFAGQKYCDYVEGKLWRLVAEKDIFGYRVVIDGACSPERVKTLGVQGVDGFVLGTSAVFGKGRPYGEIFAELRAE